jgi:hypothetical protein
MTSSEFTALEDRLERDEKDAERYRKLRRWMTSNVAEGWTQVENLASVGCYIGWHEFDAHLDRMPVCNVGLCYGLPQE